MSTQNTLTLFKFLVSNIQAPHQLLTLITWTVLTGPLAQFMWFEGGLKRWKICETCLRPSCFNVELHSQCTRQEAFKQIILMKSLENATNEHFGLLCSKLSLSRVAKQVSTTVFGPYVQNRLPLNVRWKLNQGELWPVLRPGCRPA